MRPASGARAPRWLTGGAGRETPACLADGANWVLIVLAVSGIALVLGFTVYTTTNPRFKKTGVLKAILNYLQVARGRSRGPAGGADRRRRWQLLSFLLYFNLDWPVVLKNVFGVSAITTLQINFSPITCLFRFNYYSYFVLYSVVPLVGLAGGSILFLVLLCMLRTRERAQIRAASNNLAESSGVVLNAHLQDTLREAQRAEERPITFKMVDAWVTTIIVIVFLSHPLIAKNSLEVFNCVDYDQGPGLPVASFIASDLSVSCLTTEHEVFDVAAAVVLSVFVAGVPAVGLLILIIYRNRLHDEDVERKYRFLYAGYVDSRFYWEFGTATGPSRTVSRALAGEAVADGARGSDHGPQGGCRPARRVPARQPATADVWRHLGRRHRDSAARRLHAVPLPHHRHAGPDVAR